MLSGCATSKMLKEVTVIHNTKVIEEKTKGLDSWVDISIGVTRILDLYLQNREGKHTRYQSLISDCLRFSNTATNCRIEFTVDPVDDIVFDSETYDSAYLKTLNHYYLLNYNAGANCFIDAIFEIDDTNYYKLTFFFQANNWTRNRGSQKRARSL